MYLSTQTNRNMDFLCRVRLIFRYSQSEMKIVPACRNLSKPRWKFRRQTRRITDLHGYNFNKNESL